MDYSTKVLTPAAKFKVLTLLLVVGAVSCTPLPSDPSSSPASPPATHLETPVHSVEVSHEVRHVSVEVNVDERTLNSSIISDQDVVTEHTHTHKCTHTHTSNQDAADSAPEQEPPLPSDNPTAPYNIRHLDITPTGFIDTLHPIYMHATPPRIIEAKDNVRNKKQDEAVAVVAVSTSKPSVSDGAISSHTAEADNNFPQPAGEPEEEYIGLELDEPLKDIADQISVISDQAQDIWKPIQDDIAKNIDDTVKSISDATNEAVDNTVKSISDATNEAKNILEPMQYNISKNIEETIKNINEASSEHINNAADSINEHIDSINEHINSATDSVKNAVDSIKITNSDTALFENINEDFEIVEENPEFIEEWPIAEARVGSEEVMNEALKADPTFNSNIKTDIKNKDGKNSEGTVEADSLGNDKQAELSTEIPVLVESPPQKDKPTLEQDQNQKQKVEGKAKEPVQDQNQKQKVEGKPKEPVQDQNQKQKVEGKTKEPVSKDIVEEKSNTEELPQVDQPVKAKNEENGVFIDAVKRSDTETENLESPKEGEVLEDATPSESPRESRVYIEKVDGVPKEKPIVNKDAPKQIPGEPVQDLPEVKEEDSTQESGATSPIPNVNQEQVILENKKPQGDVKMATDSPVESVKKESTIAPDIHNIPIDITKKEKIPKNKESIPKNKEESTLINDGNEEENLEGNLEEVQSSGDEHIDEEIPIVNEDGTVNEAEEPLEATDAPPLIPSESENTLDEIVDPAAGAPQPDQDITQQESTGNKTSPPGNKTSPPGTKTSRPKGIKNPKPKANQSNHVHPHKLSASEERYHPSSEEVRVAEAHPLGAGAIFGIIMGILMCSGFVVAITGFIIYQRRFHIRPKTLNSDRGYAGSDSGGYIDDDAVRVSYVNSQTDMPKEQENPNTFRLRLNTQDGE